MNTAEVIAALAVKYPSPAWVFLPEVRNGTGYQRQARTADALAMALWPSRGLELHGFEVKTSRTDWLRELKDPAKAEEMVAFCDRWWIASGDKDIVRAGELPPTWGLLVPRGAALIVTVEAPKLEAQPMDRLFIAAVLRRVTETWIVKVDIDAARDVARQEGREQGLRDATIVRSDLADLKERVARFERDSGVKITGWIYGNIGRAVRDIVEFGAERVRSSIEAHKRWAEQIVRQCDVTLRQEEPGE